MSSAEPSAFAADTSREVWARWREAQQDVSAARSTYRAGAGAKRRPFLPPALPPEWLLARTQIKQVAETDIPVLIQGRVAPGKGWSLTPSTSIAKRREAPSSPINWAAIPGNCWRSMLFGHVKCAFTGATFTKLGSWRRPTARKAVSGREVGLARRRCKRSCCGCSKPGDPAPVGSNKGAPKPSTCA
ncbi:MAG: sigma 54-interacting transcriptional regulator [Myxococcales bacterium]|nr:sigma 54-interacting transcriptional regulator [Myxococcales bacterium]